LTIWHFFAACQPNAQTIGRAAKYFRVVGLMLGLTLALANSMFAPYLHSEILSAALIAFLLARCALLTFFYGDHAQFDEISSLISEQVSFSQLLAGAAATLALVGYFLGRHGIWIALLISLFALLTRHWLQRRHGVVTHANSGAVIELGEALSLVRLATL
jgi:cobalamin synthase